VLTLPRSVRIFISSGPTDMRRSIDGLMSIVKDELEGDAYSGGRTSRKRMGTKLKAIKEELLKRRHLPIPEQGKWLGNVVRGYFAYHAVPTDGPSISSFRTQVIRHWHRALQRRSQRSRTDWVRMGRLARRWIPPARIQHPWPHKRFPRQHPRQEPGA
jgi:hypothetical protein